MATEILYIAPDGTELDLLSEGDWYRSIAYGGLTGMIGQWDVSTETAVGVPGETPTTWQVKKMEGELRLELAPGRGVSVDDAEAEVRSSFLQDEYGQLIIHRDGGQRCRTWCRASGLISPPVEVPESATDMEIRVPLVSETGLYTHDPKTKTGTVTVTNTGEVFLWPEIIWTTATTVILPSLLVVSLPAAADGKARRLSLNPYTSHEVYHLDGTVDEELSGLTRHLHLGEGVPKRQSRTYITTNGARVQWATQVLDPWRKR